MKSFTTLSTLAGIATTVSAHAIARTNAHSSSDSPQVTVKNGTISGIHHAKYNEDYFLGIPFAQPPTDELRFRVPQSINTTFDGTFEATEYAPECYGYGGDQIGYPQSDDCLYLNVVRPAGYENESLPVGVWIHGGGLYEGGTRDERYNLTFIVQNSVEMGKPIIAASIAYRLAAWGFLASQEVSGSGNTNLGLRDQRLALHWINENIAAFGGDPKKVTIWGESAGAGSVGWHLTAYGGRDDGLFRAGIMESGNPINYNSYKTEVQFQPKYDALLHATDCSKALDTLDCLRKVPIQDLQNLFNSSNDYATGWNPVVDGDFIQRWGSIQLAEGAFVKVPIIDGANTDEGTAFGPSPVNSEADFAAHISNSTLSNPLAEFWVPDVLAAYPDEPSYYIPPIEELPANYTFPKSVGSSQAYRRSAAYFGDVTMIANRRGTVETWAANGIPAYSYRFHTRPAGLSPTTGVTHFQEVAFVFDNTQGLGYDEEHSTVNPFQNKSQSYYDLAELMSKSWASFIYDLDPNGFKGRYAKAEEWPVYSLEKPENIVWDANVTSLGYAEADTWREEGIRWILDHQLAYRR